MRDTAADQRLPKEQKGGNGHEFQSCQLRVAYPQNRRARRYRRAAVPTEVIEPAEGEKHGRGPAEQEDEAECAVDERTAGRGIPGQRLVRKVVGIGM